MSPLSPPSAIRVHVTSTMPSACPSLEAQGDALPSHLPLVASASQQASSSERGNSARPTPIACGQPQTRTDLRQSQTVASMQSQKTSRLSILPREGSLPGASVEDFERRSSSIHVTPRILSVSSHDPYSDLDPGPNCSPTRLGGSAQRFTKEEEAKAYSHVNAQDIAEASRPPYPPPLPPQHTTSLKSDRDAPGASALASPPSYPPPPAPTNDGKGELFAEERGEGGTEAGGAREGERRQHEADVAPTSQVPLDLEIERDFRNNFREIMLSYAN